MIYEVFWGFLQFSVYILYNRQVNLFSYIMLPSTTHWNWLYDDSERITHTKILWFLQISVNCLLKSTFFTVLSEEIPVCSSLPYLSRGNRQQFLWAGFWCGVQKRIWLDGELQEKHSWNTIRFSKFLLDKNQKNPHNQNYWTWDYLKLVKKSIMA